jgi:hypothetical protein
MAVLSRVSYVVVTYVEPGDMSSWLLGRICLSFIFTSLAAVERDGEDVQWEVMLLALRPHLRPVAPILVRGFIVCYPCGYCYRVSVCGCL